MVLGGSAAKSKTKTSTNMTVGMNRGRGDNFTTELYQMCHPQQSNAYRGSTNPYANKYKERTQLEDEEEDDY